MDHPRAEHLQPAGALAQPAAGAPADGAGHIELHRRLGELEVVRAQPGGAVGTEHRACEEVEGALEVAQGDVLVDAHPLELEEHREMGGVVVPPECLAGDDDPLRRAAHQHAAHLDRRRVGAQQAVVVDEERVLGGPRRMAGRHVDQGEVVAVVLDLGTIDGDVAELGEDADDVAEHA